MKANIIMPVILAIIVSIGLTYLYFHSRNLDAELHNQVMHQLQLLKQANADLNEAIIEVSSRHSQNYDSLGIVQKNLFLQIAKFENTISQMQSNVSVRFDDLIRRLEEVGQEKSRLIERFKLDTALLNNSLHYYPRLLEEIESFAEKSSEYKIYQEIAHKVTYFSLNFHNDVFESAKSEIAAHKNQLRSNRSLPKNKHIYLSNFLSHSELILDSLKKRSGVASIKANTAINSILSELNGEYMKYYNRQAEKAEKSRNFMFGASLLLISIIVYVLILLAKNAIELAKEREKALFASQAKSTFLANMSHEIRTPLTAIIGFGESSLDSGQTMDERLSAIRSIVRNGKHLLQIINEILDISKIESGKLTVEKYPCNVIDTLRELESSMRFQAEEKGLAFEIKPIFPLPEIVSTDPVRFKQILFNLTNNAIKFTHSGKVEIQIACDCGNERLKAVVADTGIGLSKEQVEKLYSPFTQADSSTTRKYGGTGLGLHISKYLVEALGGVLEVHSAPGQGSQFSFSIDTGSLNGVKIQHQESGQSESTETTIISSEAPKLHGSILLAEDNLDNQELISYFIRKTGAELKVVDNGLRACEETSIKNYDLVLMDMQMPELDGLSATRRIRDSGYDKPIIALTANATNEDIDSCHNAGCDGFLSKPVDWSKFYQALSSHLNEDEAEVTGMAAIESEIIKGEPALARLVVKFLDSLPERLQDLKQTVYANDWQNMSFQLHNLKGLGGNFGYPQVTKLAARMEFEIKKQDYSKVRASLQELESLFSRLLAGKPDVTDS